MIPSSWTLSIWAAILAGCLQISSGNNDILQKQLGKTDSSIDHLTQEFGGIIQKFFFEPQKDADQMIKSGGSEAEKGYAIKKMSYVFSLTETVIYAISKEALMKAKEIMQDVGTDEQIKETGSNILLDILERRALLRAGLDGLTHSNELWKKLHMLIEHYGNIDDLEDKVSAFALQIYLHRASLIESMQMTYMEQQMLLDQYFSKTGLDEDEDSVLEDIDDYIDTKMNSPKCANMQPDSDYYNTRCLFDDEAKVSATVERLIDPKLISQIREVENEVKGHVKEWTEKEIAQVDEIEDVMDLYDRYLAKGQETAAYEDYV